MAPPRPVAPPRSEVGSPTAGTMSVVPASAVILPQGNAASNVEGLPAARRAPMRRLGVGHPAVEALEQGPSGLAVSRARRLLQRSIKGAQIPRGAGMASCNLRGPRLARVKPTPTKPPG